MNDGSFIGPVCFLFMGLVCFLFIDPVCFLFIGPVCFIGRVSKKHRIARTLIHLIFVDQ